MRHRTTMKRMPQLQAIGRFALALLVSAILLPSAAFARDSGRISGKVTDEATGDPLPGVTVTVTGPSLQGELTEFTDENGSYLITEIPPGEYLVRYYYADIVIERPNVQVTTDRTLAVNVAIPSEKAATQTIQITERAPSVDVGNTQVQTTLDKELVKRTPQRGRTYESVLTAAPGSATDDVGYSFNGATGPENSYLVEGMNTTNISYGLIGTPLTLEFIEETNLITGGYNAEYGRATGGVINVITKSGSNEFKGEVFLGFTPFQAQPQRIGRLGEAISSDRYGRWKDLDVGFTLGGPIVKDTVWFFTGFHPQYREQRYNRIIRKRLASNLTGAPGDVYEGDVQADPLAACPSYLQDRGEDVTGDKAALCAGGAFLTEDVAGAARNIYSHSWLYNYMAKFDVRLDDNNRFSVQYIGSPATFDGIFTDPNDQSGTLGMGLGNDPAIMGFGETIQTHDVIGHYVSKLFDRKLTVDLFLGMHYEGVAADPDKDTPRVIEEHERPLASFEPSILECREQVINGVSFNPCPVSDYSYGGFGFSNDKSERRFSGSLYLTYLLQLGGTHEFKFGADVEHNNYIDKRLYTGGQFYTNRLNGRVRTQFFGTEDADGNGVFLPFFEAKSEALREGFFLRDSYSPSFIPGLTVNGGVRWDLEQLKGNDGETALAVSDGIAPRIGLIYDFTEKGLSKIIASYARHYEAIPLDIADRAFAAEALIRQNVRATQCQVDALGRLNYATCPYLPVGEDAAAQILGGEKTPVSPQLKAQHSNELMVGLEYDVGYDIVLGGSFIHRDLGRVVEDLSVDGANHYFIANPGDDPDPGIVEDLQNQINQKNAELSSAQGEDATRLAEEKADLQNQLTLLKGAATFPKPSRTYNAGMFSIRKRFSHGLQLLASYTYSRTIGNYPGLYDASNTQLDPNVSAQFDLTGLLLNREGPLPNDRPHNFKITGYYFVPTSENEKDGVSFGLSFNAVSGIPIEVLGSDPLYGGAESFILPRGSGGRTPFITSVDLKIGYVLESVELNWEIFNLFNFRQATTVDEEYTFDDVLPIVGGTVDDLKTAKTPAGTRPTVNPNYGTPTSYQAPLAMRFSARLKF
ncbi:MAG: TonB-dependent receptor [Deltaproteobacteria bacterium]|nr:TonB-dependent receptor [Deltaproteobacteria bacterium]